VEFVLSNIMITEKDQLPNGQFDVINILKREYKTWVKRQIRLKKEQNSSFIEPTAKNMVRVYHGTNTAHVLDILSNGLQPRSITDISNWEVFHEGELLSSIDDVVYVTTKWHHYYADVVARKTEGSFPCYIGFDVPKSALIPDEDAFHSKLSHERYFKYHLSQGGVPFHLSGEESLTHYFTAGIPLGIPARHIREVAILGDKRFMRELLSPSNHFIQLLENWSEGKLAQEVKLSPVYKKQKKSQLNKTFSVNGKNPDSLASSLQEIKAFIGMLKANTP